MTITTIGRQAIRTGILLALLAPLAGCDENGKFSFLKPGQGAAAEDTAAEGESATGKHAVRTITKDVERPDVFHVTEEGLWDGRPSLGGVWVAHPGVQDPERVLIRNPQNGKSVIGALFRREAANPGPRLQVSSDAAAALGILAGQPTRLEVLALRREEVPIAEPAEDMPKAVPEAGEIEETSLDDPIAGAAAAIDDAEKAAAGTRPPARPDITAAAAAAGVESTADAGTGTGAAAAAPPPPSVTPSLARPWLQIGIFSVGPNAARTAEMMRKAGLAPVVKQQTSKGKTFWRVLVGPAATRAEQREMLARVREIGFADAYAVSD